MMTCRGIRGATTVRENSRSEILSATEELLRALIEANHLDPSEIASAIFTVTPDLDAAFPAEAARRMGWNRVPLLDTVAPHPPDGLPRCIRILIHWNTDRPPSTVRHIYLRDAVGLRPDLQQEKGGQEGAGLVETDPAPGAIAGAVASPGVSGPATIVVAYQGESGAYSQEAIYQHFGPHVSAMPCPTFEAIFTAVEEGQATTGLLPVENSQTGSITQAYDLLLERDLRVVGEVKLRVRHCLLALPGTTFADIRRVRSHPQALAQCERYLKHRGWEMVPAYDTAGAARELAATREPSTAVIASALAAQIYGLEVLEAGIEDSSENTTRFFLLGREEPPPAAYSKTSIVFANPHVPGALYNALGEFARRGINLTKIESRPRRNRPWHYVFYVDMEGHWRDPAVHQALMGLLTRTAFVKLLGSYPAAPEVNDHAD